MDNQSTQKKRSPSGVEFEKIVARIQQMMDTNSAVTHNEIIEDRAGNRRQYDVVVRGQFGGRQVLGVIECKDHKKKTGPEEIDAFAKKAENLGANIRLVVSRSGFTEQALRLAKHENIGCLSLLPEDPNQVGFGIGDMWYGVIRKWAEVRLTVDFVEDPAPLSSYKADSIKWSGKPVGAWFMKELITGLENITKEGVYPLEIKFKEPRFLEVEGKLYAARGVSCAAKRIYRNKRKWVCWSGDAFYDWHTGKFTIPPQGTIVGSAIEADLSAWQDYDGVVPDPKTTQYQGFVRVVAYDTQKWKDEDNKDTPDLRSL